MNLYDFGSFDICYDLEADIDENWLYGKYCLTKISIPLSVFENQDVNGIKRLQNGGFKPIGDPRSYASSTSLTFLHGFCIPSACSAAQIQDIVNFILADFPFVPAFSEETCYVKNETPELTTGAILTMYVNQYMFSRRFLQNYHFTEYFWQLF